MTRKGQVPVVVVALPFAYREGMDRYNGIMRYLRERDLDWDLQIIRETLNVEPFRQSLKGRISGVICGTAGRFADGQRGSCLVSVCLDVCQRRRIPFVGLDWPKKVTGRRRHPCGSFLNIDSEEIGSFAAEVLLKADNYASYGFVGMYSDVAWSRDRGAFFARGLRKAGRRCIRIFKGDVRARVRRAKYLLAYSGHMIETISRLCGYRTASYLGKVFLAHEGVSMGGYRDRIKRRATL